MNDRGLDLDVCWRVAIENAFLLDSILEELHLPNDCLEDTFGGGDVNFTDTELNELFGIE